MFRFRRRNYCPGYSEMKGLLFSSAVCIPKVEGGLAHCITTVYGEHREWAGGAGVPAGHQVLVYMNLTPCYGIPGL